MWGSEGSEHRSEWISSKKDDIQMRHISKVNRSDRGQQIVTEVKTTKIRKVEALYMIYFASSQTQIDQQGTVTEFKLVHTAVSGISIA